MRGYALIRERATAPTAGGRGTGSAGARSPVPARFETKERQRETFLYEYCADCFL